MRNNERNHNHSVTGAESGIEGMAPPGGGPPPRLEGTVTFQADGRMLQASPGDFLHIPRGTVHSFRNDGKVDGKAFVISPVRDPYGDARALLVLFVVVVIMFVALVF